MKIQQSFILGNYTPMKAEIGLLLTNTDLPEVDDIGETKLGLEGGQDFHFDLLDCVTAEGTDLQRLADLSVTAHCEQHLQLLYTIHRNKDALYTIIHPAGIGILNPVIHS